MDSGSLHPSSFPDTPDLNLPPSLSNAQRRGTASIEPSAEPADQRPALLRGLPSLTSSPTLASPSSPAGERSPSAFNKLRRKTSDFLKRKTSGILREKPDSDASVPPVPTLEPAMTFGEALRDVACQEGFDKVEREFFSKMPKNIKAMYETIHGLESFRKYLGGSLGIGTGPWTAKTYAGLPRQVNGHDLGTHLCNLTALNAYKEVYLYLLERDQRKPEDEPSYRNDVEKIEAESPPEQWAARKAAMLEAKTRRFNETKASFQVDVAAFKQYMESEPAVAKTYDKFVTALVDAFQSSTKPAAESVGKVKAEPAAAASRHSFSVFRQSMLPALQEIQKALADPNKAATLFDDQGSPPASPAA